MRDYVQSCTGNLDIPLLEEDDRWVIFHLPGAHLPEVIYIICQKGVYLLPEGIVSFARSPCVIFTRYRVTSYT